MLLLLLFKLLLSLCCTAISVPNWFFLQICIGGGGKLFNTGGISPSITRGMISCEGGGGPAGFGRKVGKEERRRVLF